MTFYIESLGCAKNQVDSEVMIASLEKAGFTFVSDPDKASLIVVNTCGFITSAKEESIQTSLEFKSLYPEKKVIMAGCLVQRYERDLQKDLNEIDGFIGIQAPQNIVNYICGLTGMRSFRIKTYNVESALKRRSKFLSFPGSAFVKVSEGCSNCCTYCAVPLIRGSLRSRLREEITSEIKYLLDKGIYEINLVAQDLGSFGLDRGHPEIYQLLQEISSLKEQFWLRLLYFNPYRFPEDILDIVFEDSRLLPYFDIPFQHASEKVLSRMGRKGSFESYLELIRSIRERLPQAVIRSTFLVGFPGETDEDFQRLLEFQQQSSLDWLGVFTYSREEGTPAFSYKNQIKKGIALERKNLLEQAQIAITQKRLDSMVGRSLELLIEEPVEGKNLFLARAFLQAPEVDGLVVLKAEGLKPGQHCKASIMRRNGIDLEAVL